MNLSRLRYHPDSQLMLYEPKAGHEVEDEALVDPLELLARPLLHIPEPHKHQVHFYGAYANRVRATYRAGDKALPGAEGQPAEPTPRRALSKRWRELIYRIYEVDPLDRPRCGARMKILAIIIEPYTIREILQHLDKTSSSRAPGDLGWVRIANPEDRERPRRVERKSPSRRGATVLLFTCHALRGSP